MLRSRLKRADPDVLQQLTCCLARSLLIYIGTPMVATGLWKKSDINQIEAGLYRKILCYNNTISNKVILNTMSTMKLAADAIYSLQHNVREQYTRQHKLTHYYEIAEDVVMAEDNQVVYPRSGETL